VLLHFGNNIQNLDDALSAAGLAPWAASRDVCLWGGVACLAGTRRVASISLPNLSLRGALRSLHKSACPQRPTRAGSPVLLYWARCETAPYPSHAAGSLNGLRAATCVPSADAAQLAVCALAARRQPERACGCGAWTSPLRHPAATPCCTSIIGRAAALTARRRRRAQAAWTRGWRRCRSCACSRWPTTS